MANTNQSLNVVKNTELFVTSFVGSTLDPCFTNGKIDGSPTILKQGGSFYFDYSNLANSSDLKFLKRFFGGLTSGNTFGITAGNYYDETTGLIYSFAGTYELSGKTGSYNNYISANGITYSPTIENGLYQNIGFKDAPLFTAVSGATCQYFQSFLNKDAPFNIEYMGIYGNDYSYEEHLEVVGASANNGRYLIDTFIKLTDKSEIVYINNTFGITSENLKGKKVLVNVYMRGVPDLITLSQSKQKNGIIKKIAPNTQVLEILTNQNLYQRYSRALVDSTNYYDWYEYFQSEQYDNLLNPFTYDKLSVAISFYSYVKIVNETQTTVLNPVTFAEVSTQVTTFLNVDGANTTTKSFRTSTTTSNGSGLTPVIKFDLSDSSLYGWKIGAYVDKNCSIPLNSSFYLNGVPGFDGASFIYLRSPNRPQTIYLKFEKNISLVLTINT